MAEQKCRECGHGNGAAALFCDRCGRALHAQDRDPLVGKTIAERYHLLECIGAGSAGVLYRAEHVTLRRRIALKLLHKHLATRDDAVERFRREATTVCEIDNEHIPQVFDFGRSEDGRLFFAMEFLEGETLAQAIAKAPKGQLAIERVVDILSQIADALVDAHTLGYVHRDLRPRSIFLTKRRGRGDFVKLLDFGLAKLVQPEVDAQRTAMGMTYGDPRRMAPEQARGDQVDRRADIYSLGAIGYELLTGEPPYDGSGPFEILGRVLDAPVPAIRTRRPDCPPWLESVVRTALHKAPGDRPQTVTQLLDALERKQVLPGAPPLPGGARVATLPPQAAAPSSPAQAGASAPAASPRPVATELEPMSQASKGPQSTLAMPTVVPAPNPATPANPATGRATMSYPAVKPVRPATFGVGGPAAPSPAKPTTSSDELRLLNERVPPAASPPAATSAKPAATAVSPAKPAATTATAAQPSPATSAAKPGAPTASPKPMAAAVKAAAAPAKAVIIKPSLPSRSDPTPRTTAARIEQEAEGWLATAQTFFDEPTNEEALRGVKESKEAEDAANTLLGTTAGLDTGEDAAADPGDNDTLLALSAPTAPPTAQAAAKPAEKTASPAPAVSKPAAAKPAATPSPVAASPSKPTAIAAPKPAANETSAKVAAASSAAVAAKPIVKPAAVEPSPAAAAVTPAEPSQPQRAAVRDAGSASPAPAASTAWRKDPAPAQPMVASSPADDDEAHDPDATLPQIKSEAEPAPSAVSPAPSEDDTIRHGKVVVASPTTAKVTKIAAEPEPAAEAETESSQTPESGPPAGLNQVETAWFAKPAAADGFAEDESYTITRKKPPIWLYAGAASLVLVGGLILFSGGKKPTETPTPASTPTVSASNPSPAPAQGNGTPAGTANPTSPSSAAPAPVIVEPLGQTSKPAEPAAKPSEPSPSPVAKSEPVAPTENPGKPVVQPLPPPSETGPAAKAPAAPLIDRAADAALELAAARPWNTISLRDIATAAGVDLADLFDQADGKGALLAHIAARFDRAALQTPADGDVHDRLFDAAMARVEAMEPH
ncbi:MAG TPA: protein kinase, partial [Pseudomonadota bacterium]|nr:protein kinase [Pseudomonadota bacterium]